MKIKVLVVDDSAFFRKRIAETLEADPNLEVVATAANGIEAVEQVRSVQPDVITMDIEMPEMDGIEAVKRIMAERPTPILMFSSLSYEGARVTLDALEAGALDFLPKQLDAVTGSNEYGSLLLQRRVVAISRRRPKAVAKRPLAAKPFAVAREASMTPPDAMERPVRQAIKIPADKVVAIGASTGGPIAVQRLLAQLPADFPVPIVTAIHMPSNFTTAYADRLNGLCRLEVREAMDGDDMQPGRVLLAPGGKQLVFEKLAGRIVVRVRESLPEQIYRPSVDVVFGSAARAVGAGILAIVLTGMGADGVQGAKLLKEHGAKIWSQDEESCVVFGMPQAVQNAGLSDRVLSLSEMETALPEQFS